MKFKLRPVLRGAIAAVVLQAASGASSAQELRYPSIRLEVTESKLNPTLQKDKQELVEASQILEDILHKSGAVYKDPALETAVSELIPVDRMGEKAKGFYYRVYLLKDPDVNAMSVPSGSIYLNSGLLATLDNFEQLRAVMAHEAYHVIDQDIVYEFRRYKNETGFFKVLSLVAAPAVAYAISESDSDTARTIANVYTGASWAVGLAYQLSIYGYSRGHENECDEFALKIFDQQGYDLLQVKKVFEHLHSHEKKYDRNIFHTHLLATHETPKQRMGRVDKFIVQKTETPRPADAAPDKRYYDLTRDIRVINARLNVRLGRVQHALDDLERLKAMFPDDARVMNAFGEAYSRLAEDRKVLKYELNGMEWRKASKEKEDVQRAERIKLAVESFEKARALDAKLPDPYRGEALMRESQKEYARAVDLYGRYLETAVEPKDKRYVQAKIERLKKMIEQDNEKKAKEAAKAKKREAR